MRPTSGASGAVAAAEAGAAPGRRGVRRARAEQDAAWSSTASVFVAPVGMVACGVAERVRAAARLTESSEGLMREV
eukprot:scaffold1235_cov87-Isochrysis_galbana.AAC.2